MIFFRKCSYFTYQLYTKRLTDMMLNNSTKLIYNTAISHNIKFELVDIFGTMTLENEQFNINLKRDQTN